MRFLNRSLAIYEKSLGCEHPSAVGPLSGIGSVLVNLGKFEQAIEHLERTYRICQVTTCEEEDFGRALFELARALVATKRNKARAISLAKQAREEFGKVAYLKKDLEEVNAWLKFFSE